MVMKVMNWPMYWRGRQHERQKAESIRKALARLVEITERICDGNYSEEIDEAYEEARRLIKPVNEESKKSTEKNTAPVA